MPFSYALQHGIGALINSVNALSPYTATAGGAGDNAQQTGITLDRQSIGREYLSAQVVIPYKATMAAAKKTTVSSIVEDSADGTNWATYSRFVGDIFGAPSPPTCRPRTPTPSPSRRWRLSAVRIVSDP